MVETTRVFAESSLGLYEREEKNRNGFRCLRLWK